LQLPKEESVKKDLTLSAARNSKKTVQNPKSPAHSQNQVTVVKKNGVVSLAFHEELELLISGYEDSKLRVWGYNVVRNINLGLDR
jgi:hypothetical protein